jgi:hypothetical protein
MLTTLALTFALALTATPAPPSGQKATQRVAQAAKKQDPHAIVTEARQRYELALVELRARAVAALDGSTLDVRDKLALGLELDAGELPAHELFAPFQRELDRLVQSLVSAYLRAAEGAYGQDRPLAAQLVSEAEVWARISEWAVWQPLLTGFAPPDGEGESTGTTLPCEFPEGARIEVTLRLRSAGPVRLQLPVDDERALEVELLTSERSCRAIVTRDDEGSYTYDVGVERRRAPVEVTAEHDGHLVLLDPTGCVERVDILTKVLSFGEPREAKPASDVGDAAGAADVAEWSEGTRLIGYRTRENGKPKLQFGTVLSNEDGILRVEMTDYHKWIYVFERGKKDKTAYTLVGQEKVDPRANDVVPKTSRLRLVDDTLTGSYKWVVNGSSTVSGEFDFRAFGTFGTPPAVRGVGKNALAGHEAWTAGSTITGMRGDAALTGHVLSADGKRLRIVLRETFYVEGKKHTPNFVYEFERQSNGGKGEIMYRLDTQRSLEDGPEPGHRFDFTGELELSGRTLRGRIQFKNFPKERRMHDNEFALEVGHTEVR